MNYLIPTFNCALFSSDIYYLRADVKYKIVEMCEKCGLVFGEDESIPFVFSLQSSSENILNVKIHNDCYYFLFPTRYSSNFSTQFKYKSKDVWVCLNDRLQIFINGELICEQIVDKLKFSHFEIEGELCLIYFSGKRNYLLVIKEDELCFANYYDEFNKSENEKLFMCKLFDSLNHGLVCRIKDKKFDSYLVYLDEEEMSLKTEFVSFVFLDCVKAKNFKYCSNLLSEELKIGNEEQIADFFPEFDKFYSTNENEFVLLRKNTLAGIYSFNVENNLITNITNLHR